MPQESLPNNVKLLIGNWENGELRDSWTINIENHNNRETFEEIHNTEKLHIIQHNFEDPDIKI